MAKELKDTGAGLVAAAMISIVPGYISRSVAGSYDNEGIAIFCMLLGRALAEEEGVVWPAHGSGNEWRAGIKSIASVVAFIRP